MSSVTTMDTDLVISDVAGGRPTDTVTAATLLRAFDAARRQMAQRLSACDGLSVGYDQLSVEGTAFASLAAGTAVAVSAMLLDTRPGAHQVEYLATVRPQTAGDPGRSVVLARARGWTLTPHEKQPAPRASRSPQTGGSGS